MKTGLAAFLVMASLAIGLQLALPAATAIFTPVIVHAATLGDPCATGVGCAGGSGVGGIQTAIVKIINLALGLVAIIAVAVIIIAGFRLIISQGENVDQARKAIIWAIGGIIVILLAGTIVNLAVGLF